MGSAVASATASRPRNPGFAAAIASMAGESVHTDGGQTRGPAAGAAPYVDGSPRMAAPRSTAAERDAPARRWATASRPRCRPTARSPRAPKPVLRPSEALQPRLAQAHQFLRQAQFAGEIVGARRISPTAERFQQRAAPARAGACPGWWASANSSPSRNRGCGASRAAAARAVAGPCESGTGTSGR